MGRHRKPIAVALTEGRDVAQPGRYKDRTEVGADMPSLGEPPEWVTDTAGCKMESAWRLFMKEATWLKVRDRVLVGMAAQVQGTMMAGAPVSIQEMTLLKGLLSSMGMTPADAGKVIMPDKPKEPRRDIAAPRPRR